MSTMLAIWSFIAAVVLVSWRGARSYAQNSPAHSASHLGEQYQYHEELSKAGLLVNLLLTFKLPPGPRFQLRRESWFDRFGKGMLLSVEPQTNEPRFDRMFYLDSDDDALIKLLRNSPSLGSTLVSLMTRLRLQKARLISLSAENGALILYMHVFSAPDPKALRAECVAWLEPLLEALRALPQGTPARSSATRDDIARKLAFGLFSFGGFASSWIFFMSPDRLINPADLITWSSFVAAGAFLALTVWVLPRLGRASNRHRAVFQWIVLASIGCLLSSFVVIRAINIHLDFRPSTTEPLDRATLFKTHKRKSGATYRLNFHGKGWPERHDETMEIGWFEHRRLSRAWLGDESDQAVLVTHPGLLGFGWREVQP